MAMFADEPRKTIQ